MNWNECMALLQIIMPLDSQTILPTTKTVSEMNIKSVFKDSGLRIYFSEKRLCF